MNMALTSKCCSRCKESRPLFDFSAHTKAADGKQSQCKPCFAERARLTRVGKPCITCGTPKEPGVPRGARLCLQCAKVCYVCKAAPRRQQHRTCPACYSAQEKVRNATPERQAKTRVTRIATKFKVPRAEAERLAEIKQCAACEKNLTRPGDTHVDHCHKTGKVRDVLCFNCNAALGHLSDDPARLTKLLGYIRKHVE